MTHGDPQEPRTTPAGQTHTYLWLIQAAWILLPLGASRHWDLQDAFISL